MDIHYVRVIGQLGFSFSVNKYDTLIQLSFTEVVSLKMSRESLYGEVQVEQV